MASSEDNQPCSQCVWWIENGDGSQRVCEVCTEYDRYGLVETNDNNISFPDGNDDCVFPDVSDDGDEAIRAIPWGKVPLREWQRVVGIISVDTRFGSEPEQLPNYNLKIYQAWTTELIANCIVAKEREKAGRNLFIKSMGKKKSGKSKNFYYDFRCKLM